MSESRSSFLQGMFFLILAQTMVGINIVSSKYVVATLPILLILTIRFTLASFMLLPLHWLTPAKKIPIRAYFAKLTRRDWFFIVAQGLCAGIFFNVLMLWGLHYTGANVAGIITSALPAIIAILSLIVLGETISGKKIVCVFFATLGLVVIACDKLRGVSMTQSLVGDVLIFLSLLPEAMYYILCKMHVNALPVFLVSALLNGINAVLLLAILLFYFHTWGSLTITLSDWVVLMILGLSSGLFYVFWYFGYKKVDGVMASLSTAIMPVATVMIAWLFLGEQLTLWQSVGMSMVIFSIAIYAKR